MTLGTSSAGGLLVKAGCDPTSNLHDAVREVIQQRDAERVLYSQATDKIGRLECECAELADKIGEAWDVVPDNVKDSVTSLTGAINWLVSDVEVLRRDIRVQRDDYNVTLAERDENRIMTREDVRILVDDRDRLQAELARSEAEERLWRQGAARLQAELNDLYAERVTAQASRLTAAEALDLMSLRVDRLPSAGERVALLNFIDGIRATIK